LGARPGALLVRIQSAERPNGAIGPGNNSTAWGILALRQAGERAPKPAVRYLIRHQARSGGFAWNPGGQPDSNDTAAAVEALRAPTRRKCPLPEALRAHAGLGHCAGAARAQPPAVSAVATQPASGRTSRPSATTPSTRPAGNGQENQRRSSSSGATTAARTP